MVQHEQFEHLCQVAGLSKNFMTTGFVDLASTVTQTKQ